MIIGIPREVKNHEYRVGMALSGVRELVHHGHKVIIETNAGIGIGITDQEYESIGASILSSPDLVFEKAELIIKVKEPQPNECKKLNKGQALFTYLHLAADSKQADLLMQSGCTAIAYETVTDTNGGLPLLAPMSEIAGRMSVQAGAHCLEKAQNGRGTLLGGVPGVTPGRVVIIGGGVAGYNAARIAVGTGADVTLLETSLNRMRQLDDIFTGKIKTRLSNISNIEEEIIRADLVIGAVLLPGGAAPKLINQDMLSKMKQGSVIVDIAIDQGGMAESSRPTSHDNPTYVEKGVVHYCVTNMPGAVARTSTIALNNATLPYILRLADQGIIPALKNDPHLKNGLNIHEGNITHEAVAKALNKKYISTDKFLAA